MGGLKPYMNRSLNWYGHSKRYLSSENEIVTGGVGQVPYRDDPAGFTAVYEAYYGMVDRLAAGS